MGERLLALTTAFRKRRVFATATVSDTGSFKDGLVAGMQVLQGAFFRPNIVFLPMPDSDERLTAYHDIFERAQALQLGILLYAPHPVARLGQRHQVNVWIRDRSPDWRLRWDIGNLDLSILIAYKLKLNWNAHLRLITVIEDEHEEENARNFMSQLMDLARLPDTEVVVAKGDFMPYVATAPQADLNIFGLAPNHDFGFVRIMVQETRSTCLFIRDSGQESALA